MRLCPSSISKFPMGFHHAQNKIKWKVLTTIAKAPQLGLTYQGDLISYTLTSCEVFLLPWLSKLLNPPSESLNLQFSLPGMFFPFIFIINSFFSFLTQFILHPLKQLQETAYLKVVFPIIYYGFTLFNFLQALSSG